MITYSIKVVTGNVEYAGTDANVYVTLTGPNGSTREIYLDDPDRDDFEKGQTDVFVRTAEDVGPYITSIKVRHDNSGGYPGWFLNTICVTIESPEYEFRKDCFDFHRWLAVDEEEGAICLIWDYNSGVIPCSTMTAAGKSLVLLKAQLIYSGPRPYTASFPTFGSNNGTLTSIKNITSGFDPIYIKFVKSGFTTADCDNSDAVVILAPQASTTPDNLFQIYGSSNPPLAVSLVACINTALDPPPDTVPIEVTYTKLG